MPTRNCQTLEPPESATGSYIITGVTDRLGIDTSGQPSIDRFLTPSSYDLYMYWDMGIPPISLQTPPLLTGDPRLRYLTKNSEKTSTSIIIFLPDPTDSTKFKIISPSFKPETIFLKTDYSISTNLTNAVFYNASSGLFVIFGYGSTYELTKPITFYGVPAQNIITFSPNPGQPNVYYYITEITDTTITCTYAWMRNPGTQNPGNIVIDISGAPARIQVVGIGGAPNTGKQFETSGIPTGLLTIPAPFSLVAPPTGGLSITPGVYSKAENNEEIFTFTSGSMFSFENMTLPQAKLTSRSYKIVGDQIDFGDFWPSVKITGTYVSPTSFKWNGSTFGPIQANLTGNWLLTTASVTWTVPISFTQSLFLNSSWYGKYQNSILDNLSVIVSSDNINCTVTDANAIGGQRYYSDDSGFPSKATLNANKTVITGKLVRTNAAFTMTKYFNNFIVSGNTFLNSILTIKFIDDKNGTYNYNDVQTGSSGYNMNFQYELYGNQLVTDVPILMANTNIFRISDKDLTSVNPGFAAIVLLLDTSSGVPQSLALDWLYTTFENGVSGIYTTDIPITIRKDNTTWLVHFGPNPLDSFRIRFLDYKNFEVTDADASYEYWSIQGIPSRGTINSENTEMTGKIQGLRDGKETTFKMIKAPPPSKSTAPLVTAGQTISRPVSSITFSAPVFLPPVLVTPPTVNRYQVSLTNPVAVTLYITISSGSAGYLSSNKQSTVTNFNYTLPARGVMNITITGSASQTATFDSTSINYQGNKYT